MGFFRKIKAGLVNHPIEQFVGEVGNMFFDVDTGELRLSDGVTPGGIPIMGGTGGSGAVGIRSNGQSLGSATVLNFGNNITVEVSSSIASVRAVPVKISNSAPIVAVLGDLWFNSTNNELKMYYNGSWVSLITNSAVSGAVIFDGGNPSSDYSNGPAFDFGGVI